MNDNIKKISHNLIQISNPKSKRSTTNNSNPQIPKEDHKLLQQGFLSQADLNLQNILSSFFSNVEEEGLSDSMIESKIAQIRSNKNNISKRHYNSSSSSSEDNNSYSHPPSKINTNSKHNNNRYLKVASVKSNGFSRLQKSNGTTKSNKSAYSKVEEQTIDPIQLFGELKNVTQSLSTRKNSITKKKNLTKRSFSQDKHNNRPKILFQPSEDEKDVFKMVPLMNNQIDNHTLRSLCSDIHDNINIKPENMPKELFHIPSDRSVKGYNEEKEDDENKLFQNETINPFKTINTFEIHKKEFPFRRLQRRNNIVYDSLSEDEENELDHTVINPNSLFKIGYDGVLVLLTIYSFIYVPFSIAYIHKDRNTLSFYYIFNAFIDFYYITDIVLSFKTAYYDMEEQFIQEASKIVDHYLNGWFLLDVISGFPFITGIDTYMLLHPEGLFTKSTFQIYSNSNIMFMHLLKFLRLIKGLKIFFDNSFVSFIVDNYFHYLTYSKWTRLYITLIAFFIFVHVLSSSFVFLGFAYYPSWIEVEGLDIHSFMSIYITSFYYIWITVFGIGYGDIVPINIHERVFSVFLLIVGVMIYSWTVSAISSYSDPKDEKTNEYNEKMAVLEHIKLANNQVSTNLNRKIQRFLSYNLEHEQFNSEEILEQLPVKLKNEVIYEMYKTILDNFIFFKSFHNNNFSIKVLLSFKPIIMIKNELVISEGDYIEEMIFVKQGCLVLELPIPSIITEDFDKTNTLNTIISNNIFSKTKTQFGNGETKLYLNKNFTKAKWEKKLEKEEKFLSYERQYVKLIEIRKNEHFGDIMMFLNQRCPLRVRIKSTKAELYLLKKTDAIDISMSFPKIWRKIIRKSLFNYEQLNRLVRKTLRFFFLSNQKSLYRLERRYNLVSAPSYNDTNITDLAFRDVNRKVIDLNSNHDSSNSLATIPSCIDENSSSHKSIAQLPILALEEDNDNELKNTESSTSQLIPDKKPGGGILKISSTKTLPSPQLMGKKYSMNRMISNISPNRKLSKPSIGFKEYNNQNKKEETVMPHNNHFKDFEELDDSNIKLAIDYKENSKNQPSFKNTNEKQQMPNQNNINSELLPGETIFQFEDYQNKSITNLNIDECLISIKQNYRNFIFGIHNKVFVSSLCLDKTNGFEYIVDKPQTIISHAKTKKTISLKNDTLSNKESTINMPPIQIISNTPLSRRHTQMIRPIDLKSPALDCDKNILSIPGLSPGNKRDEGNNSSRSFNNDNNNNSFRSIFDSIKKIKTPDTRPRKISAVPNNSNRGSINLLQEIGENIHKNSVNLNNPSLFYSNAFTNMINKVNNDQQLNDKQINKKLTTVLKIIEDNNSDV